MPIQTARNQVVRGKKRANYDPSVLESILSAGFLCHVAFLHNGEARVLPTAYARMNQALYIHGHRQNNMLHSLCNGQSVSLSVTHLDGLVLARSAFHHSVNYRSAVLFGRAQIVEGLEKEQALNKLVDQLVPGRIDYLLPLRPNTPQELAATLVVKFNIEESSVKIRSGQPIDSETDYDLPLWAGVVDLEYRYSQIKPCPRLNAAQGLPDHVANLVTHQ